MKRSTIYELIDAERSAQDKKYPMNIPSSGEFTLLLQRKLHQLGEEWYYGGTTIDKRFLQIATLAIAYLETLDVDDQNTSPLSWITDSEIEDNSADI